MPSNTLNHSPVSAVQRWSECASLSPTLSSLSVWVQGRSSWNPLLSLGAVSPCSHLWSPSCTNINYRQNQCSLVTKYPESYVWPLEYSHMVSVRWPLEHFHVVSVCLVSSWKIFFLPLIFSCHAIGWARGLNGNAKPCRSIKERLRK